MSFTEYLGIDVVRTNSVFKTTFDLFDDPFVLCSSDLTQACATITPRHLLLKSSVEQVAKPRPVQPAVLAVM